VDADREAEAEEAIELRDALIAGLAGAASDLEQTGHELLRAATWLPWQKKLMVALLVVQTVIMATVMVALFALAGIATANKTNTSNQRAYSLIAVQCAHEGTDAEIEACFNRKAHELGLK
jgi:hypothetical protein